MGATCFEEPQRSGHYNHCPLISHRPPIFCILRESNTDQMFFPFTDTPQIEEVMYQWTDESIEQFLDEQGDIVGMEIQCDEFKQNDYTV